MNSAFARMAEAARLAGSLATLSALNPRSSRFAPVIDHGPRRKGRVALTFDDGPNEPHTLQVRDILDANGVKASFFGVGRAIEQRPDLAEALLKHDHLLGNHSYAHRWKAALTLEYREMASTNDVFRDKLGIEPKFFRPPYGTHTPAMSDAADAQGVRIVTWDVMAWDWNTQDGDLIAKRVLRRVKPGSIVLLHDGHNGDLTSDRSGVVAALPQILKGLEAMDLEPVRLDKLLGLSAYL